MGKQDNIECRFLGLNELFSFFTRLSSYRSIAVEPLKFTGFGSTGIGVGFVVTA
jgi:hypothetical protein